MILICPHSMEGISSRIVRRPKTNSGYTERQELNCQHSLLSHMDPAESAYATGMVSQDTDIFNYELFCSVASFTRSDRHVIVSARLRASSPRWNLFLPSTHSF